MSGRTHIERGEPFAFSPENEAEAKRIIAKYPPGRQASAVLPLMDMAQRQNGGWITQSIIEYIADYLEMPSIQVYEVATFYTMFSLKPIGRHHLQVCTNIACMLRGSDEVLDACREVAGIGPGETSEDGLFTVTEVECLGACVNAPMMQIGDDYYEDLDGETTKKILGTLKAGGTPPSGSQIGRRASEPADGLTSLTLYYDPERLEPEPTEPGPKSGDN